MFGNCVLVPATYYNLTERYTDRPCNHCVYSNYGCPTKNKILVKDHYYIPIENSAEELPKCGIWCKNCKAENGKIQHEVLWNGRHAYAIKCKVCGAEFLLYKEKVHQQYTGFVNGNGNFVKPDKYGNRLARELMAMNSKREDEEPELVLSIGAEESSNVFADAFKKAGISW